MSGPKKTLSGARRLLAGCVLALLAAGPAAASSLLVYGSGGMGINPSGVDARAFTAPSYRTEVSGAQTTTIEGQTSGSWAQTGFFAEDARMASQARAAYGELGVLAMSWASAGMYHELIDQMAARNIWYYGANADAYASFTDSWTIDAGRYNGSRGTVAVTIELDGTRTTPYFDHRSDLRLSFRNTTYGGNTDLSDLYAGTYTLVADVVYGVASDFYLSLAAATTAAGRVHNFYYHQYSQGGLQEVDFLHTATITGLAFRDASGAPIDPVAFSSESGARYGLAPVPEPATTALFMAGMGVLLLAARRRA